MRKSTMPALALPRPPFRVYAETRTEGLAPLARELARVAEDFRTARLELNGRVQHIEQRLARRGGDGGMPSAGAFRAALNSDAAREALAGFARHGRARFSVSAAILSVPSPPGITPPAERRPEIVASAQRALRVRDLLTVTPTAAGSVEYVKETGFTNAAAPVSEGATKPESTIEFEVENRPVRTIAHWTQASKQVLDDVARLGAFVDGRLRYGIQLSEDGQVLLGDGTGQNLAGLVPAATAFSAPAGIALDTMADYVGAAIAQLRGIEHEPDGVVLHPNDWQKISQQKGADGHYLIPGGPFSTAAPILFNKPVALTTAMPQDEFLVGQFAVGAELFEREETLVELSTEDRDNFVRNLVTIRAEERVALAIYRPEAFIHGDFGIVT